MLFKDQQKRKENRQLDTNRLELMIAELEDMRSRHLSAYFKIKCNSAIAELVKAQNKLRELSQLEVSK